MTDHDDPPPDGLRQRAQALGDKIRGLIPDTPGHRARMEHLHEGRRRLTAMVPTTHLRAALDDAGVNRIDFVIQGVANDIVREWTLFCVDLRALARELREEQQGAPVRDDEVFLVDETLFRAVELPNRMSRVHLRHGGGATTWRDHCRAMICVLLPEPTTELADQLIGGFTTNLRVAVDAGGGTLHVYGLVITKTERGYTIARDVPPPSPNAS